MNEILAQISQDSHKSSFDIHNVKNLKLVDTNSLEIKEQYAVLNNERYYVVLMEIVGPSNTVFDGKKYLLTFLLDQEHPKYAPELYIKCESEDFDKVHDQFESTQNDREQN